MVEKVRLIIPSPNPLKKLRAVFEDGSKVDFGAFGYSDYTLHKDPVRWENYKSRHRPTENWGKSGVKTAGFWSRWILWNKPSLIASIKDTEKRFGLTIILSRGR
jgi:hypothetical protein